MDHLIVSADGRRGGALGGEPEEASGTGVRNVDPRGRGEKMALEGEAAN